MIYLIYPVYLILSGRCRTILSPQLTIFTICAKIYWMENFREFLRNKRNLASLLVLVFIALSLPLGLYLLKQQQTYRSNAAGELIALAEGPCIETINGKKVAVCNTIPLKLYNPFATTSASPSTSASNSASPSATSSASPSATASATACATSVSSGAALISAMSCYKNTEGINRRLTLPAGTIEVDEKISAPSDLTLSGAGMGQTIIKKSAAFDSDDALMANDSSNGQKNIILRDFTLQGDGQRTGNSCCYGLKLQNINNAFVINVASNNWGIDGIFLGQRPNKPGATNVRINGCQVNNNGRNGISLVDGSNNVIDHCTISGNSTNELVSAIDLEPDNGNTVSNNHIFENTITNNRNNGIQILQNPNDPGGVVSNNFICNNSFSGNNGTDFDDQGSGTQTSGCTAGNLNLPSAMRQLPARSVAWSEFNLISNFIAQAQTATPSASNSPSPVASAPATTSYRLAETQAGLSSASWISYNSSPIVTNFTVSNTPGTKEIWVQFINPSGQSLTDHIPAFELLPPSPTISGVNCTMDITNKNLKVTVTGTNLGLTKGTVTANGTAMEVASWDNSTIVGLLTSSTIPTTGQKYSVIVKRADLLQSTAQTCQVNTSAVSLGARVFCRAPGKFDVSNVVVTIAPLETPDKKVEETVTIDKDGVIQGIKTKLQIGQQYIITAKAPKTLRRNTTITAQEGTTVVNTNDGKPFILPIGDIAPSTPDGQINGLDRAELVKQWRVLSSSASGTLTADFNQDNKVNSIDWACMKYDFNSKDDVPGNTTGSSYTNGLNVSTGQGSAIFSF